MNDIILSQILSIRDSGLVNMFDCAGVQRVAFEHHMHDLVAYIEEDPSRYFYYILYGEESTNNGQRYSE